MGLSCSQSKRKRRTQPCLFFCIKGSVPRLLDNVTVGKSQISGCGSHHKFSHCATQNPFPIKFAQSSFHLTRRLPFQLVAMTSRSYSTNDVVTLGAMAGVNPIHAESLSFPDHQSALSPSSAAFQPDAMATTLCSSNDFGAPTITPVTNPNGWAAKQTWATHQAFIKQLYLDEKKPLAEVMRLMESQHGFRATSVIHAVLLVSVSLTSRRVKMYKTHIKQWGLDKKNKEPEMRAIVRKRKQRADQGKCSIIRVRGQVRDFAEVFRYFDRKGVSIDDIIARQTASPTPEAVECVTPLPSPILTPQVLAIPERMFRCIRDYFKGSFESGTWIKTEPLSRCYFSKGEENGVDYMNDFEFQCHLACSLFSRDLFQEAGQTLIAATATIKKILSAEDPGTLPRLFVLIENFRRWKRDDIALIVLRQFSALGKVLLSVEHPLSRICEWLQTASWSDFDDIAAICMKSMADQFESVVGPMHQSTLDARLDYIRIFRSESNAYIPNFSKLLGECEETLGPHDSRTLQVRSWLAQAYFIKNYTVEARKLSEEIIAYSQYVPPTAHGLYYQVEGLYILAGCQYHLGEVDLGIATLHKAIELVMSAGGPRDGRARYWLVKLEDWYFKKGDWSSAFQMRDWRERILESINLD